MPKTAALESHAGVPARRCPSCQSSEVHRSRRRGLFEKSLGRILFLHPYRCASCDARYFAFGRQHAVATPEHASPPVSPQAL